MSLDAEVRPVRPGVEVGIPSGPPGTLGLIVTNAAKERFALSCSHVLARCGQASKDTIVQQPTDLFVKPSTIAIGLLTATFTSLSFGGPTNVEDLALAKLDANIATSPAFFQSDRIPRRAHAGHSTDMSDLRTVLYGRMNNGVDGQTSSVQHERCRVVYPGFGTATFEGIVEYHTVNAPGDSGAAVMLADSDVVLGIHIGGDVGKKLGYFVPIASFLEQHALTILTG